MKQLVMIHGRSQQEKDSIALKQFWIDSLKKGMAKIGKDLPITPDDIRFPYYGDTLAQLCDGEPASTAAQIVVRGEIDDSAERMFAAAMIKDLARQLGITEAEAQQYMDGTVKSRGIENWPVVLGFLRALDKHVPGAGSASIALATHDVYQYLRTFGIAQEINAGVIKAFTPGADTVVVSHSLGTIVAYEVLKELGTGFKVPQHITLGSPLAIPAVKQALAPMSKPACVGEWFNGRDPVDVVALYPMKTDDFPIKPIKDEVKVANFTENHHSIEGYLEFPAVAQWIYDALVS